MRKNLSYIILYPFSLVYGGITGIRNFLFDKGIFKSVKFDIPVISVGNITVGGTGKTPHTEYIISLLQKDYNIAVLSRGYKRKTKGFYLADENSDASVIGDEPYQIFSKFPHVIVAVDEQRVHGINELRSRFPALDLIILDDAYQHRKVTPGVSILLSDFSRLFTKDCLLPSGRLRESRKGSKRADLIIVTKCDPEISSGQMDKIKSEISRYSDKTVLFSAFQYNPLKPVFLEGVQERENLLSDNPAILVVAGIVSPQPIIEYLNTYSSHIEHLFFPDHHDFTEKDISEIEKKFNGMNTENKMIVLTEKDASRIVSNKYYPEKMKQVTYALPVEVKILGNQENLLTDKIQDYVKKNSRNG